MGFPLARKENKLWNVFVLHRFPIGEIETIINNQQFSTQPKSKKWTDNISQSSCWVGHRHITCDGLIRFWWEGDISRNSVNCILLQRYTLHILPVIRHTDCYGMKASGNVKLHVGRAAVDPIPAINQICSLFLEILFLVLGEGKGLVSGEWCFRLLGLNEIQIKSQEEGHFLARRVFRDISNSSAVCLLVRN